jgi:hypothetical protein
MTLLEHYQNLADCYTLFVRKKYITALAIEIKRHRMMLTLCHHRNSDSSLVFKGRISLQFL